MFDQIEMWPSGPKYANGIETPNLEPPEPSSESDADYDDGVCDEGDFDFEMPVNDEDSE